MSRYYPGNLPLFVKKPISVITRNHHIAVNINLAKGDVVPMPILPVLPR
jgi:hypothetical protein